MKKFLSIIILGLLYSNISYALPDCKGEEISKWKNCIGTINQDGNIYKGIFSEETTKLPPPPPFALLIKSGCSPTKICNS